MFSFDAGNEARLSEATAVRKHARQPLQLQLVTDELLRAMLGCPRTTKLVTRIIPRAGKVDTFVGWVQPTVNGMRTVGCTHPTMTRSLPREV
jgi:hypothetical protein